MKLLLNALEVSAYYAALDSVTAKLRNKKIIVLLYFWNVLKVRCLDLCSLASQHSVQHLVHPVSVWFWYQNNSKKICFAVFLKYF